MLGCALLKRAVTLVDDHPHTEAQNMTHEELSRRIVEALGLTEDPIAIYYSNEKPAGAFEWEEKSPHFCTIAGLSVVRKGTPLAINGDHPGCGGASFFLGWVKDVMPHFAEFLSQDETGKGERYKKTPEIAQAFIDNRNFVPANGRYCVFQKLKDLNQEITPEVVIFFADADGISGLVWLANYGRKNQAVIAPFSAGCGSIVSEARAQALENEPKAVLGTFDPSARPWVEKNQLSFSAPWSLFSEMVENLPGSFVEIDPWLKIKGR